MCFVTGGTLPSNGWSTMARAFGCATLRLSQGRFHWWPRAQTAAWRLSARELHILLWNGHPEAAHRAEDWRRVAEAYAICSV